MVSELTDSGEFRMIAKTLYGLEGVLADELEELGGRNVELMNRSVAFYGNTRLLYEANFRCRTATRILMPVHTFTVHDADSLYREVSGLNWPGYFDSSRTFAVDATVSFSPFANSMFVAQKVKDAVVDRFRSAKGIRPSVDKSDPEIRINMHIQHTEATISLDSSGDPLYKRGYRTEAGEAPLNEVLAAGIIDLSGWNGQTSLADGMCGSGTFVIEGAMKARQIAPGLSGRSFAFMRWLDFDRAMYDDVYYEAKKRIRPEIACGIHGGDKDKTRIQQAIENAKRAGVSHTIEFETGLFDRQQVPDPPGILIMNPPYGERMRVDDLVAFYAYIGDTLKRRYTGYSAYILTGNLEAAKRIGLRTSRKIKLYNGPIESRLLRFDIYEGSRKRA